MNTKNLVLMALLIGIGTVLYLVIPGYGNGMRPDFMLTMMFIGILIFPTAKEAFLLAITTGILSGLFTTMPGGFFPNIIDKAVTGMLFFATILLLRKVTQKIQVSALLVGVGTCISGAIFLAVTLLFVGLPGGNTFTVLFGIVVLPTIILNMVAFIIIYPIIQKLLKRTNFKTALS